MPSDLPLLSLRAAFLRQFLRTGRSIMTRPADVANPLLFFFMVITLFPLGLGPDPARLAALAPGILWVVALLGSLMVSAKLFASDFEDGSLEQLVLAPYPLAVTALAEVSAHWLATGFLLALVSPIFGVMLGILWWQRKIIHAAYKKFCIGWRPDDATDMFSRREFVHIGKGLKEMKNSRLIYFYLSNYNKHYV